MSILEVIKHSMDGEKEKRRRKFSELSNGQQLDEDFRSLFSKRMRMKIRNKRNSEVNDDNRLHQIYPLNNPISDDNQPHASIQGDEVDLSSNMTSIMGQENIDQAQENCNTLEEINSIDGGGNAAANNEYEMVLEFEHKQDESHSCENLMLPKENQKIKGKHIEEINNQQALQDESFVKITKLRKIMEKFITVDNLFGIICLGGNFHFSELQYNFIRNITHILSKDLHLPSFKTVKTTNWEHFLEICLPKSKVIVVRRKNEMDTENDFVKTISLKRSEEYSVDEICETSDVRSNHKINLLSARVVPPSEWAKLDIITPSVFNNIFYDKSKFSKEDKLLDIENSPSIQERWTFLSGSTLWLEERNQYVPGCFGDLIRFKTRIITCQLNADQKQYWRWRLSNVPLSNIEGNNRKNNNKVPTVDGSIGPVWCAGHLPFQKNDSFDNQLQNMLNTKEMLDNERLIQEMIEKEMEEHLVPVKRRNNYNQHVPLVIFV